jgi:hypothetical protein
MSWQGLGTTGERICNDLVSHLRPIALSKEAARASCIETRATACARLAHPLFWHLDHVTIVALILSIITIGFFFIIPGLVLLAPPTLLYYSVTLLRWPCQRSVAASL